jgi:hypothetical protein
MIPDDHKIDAIGGSISLLNTVPTNKKLLPFPLENIEEDIGDIYFKLDVVRKRIEVVKRDNGVCKGKVRNVKLQKMQYKINTAMSLLRKLVLDLDDMWVN